MNHTPGPWKIEKRLNSLMIRAQEVDVIAIALPDCEPSEANARLIAAAPAMKGLLESTASVIDNLYREGAFRRLETGSDRERDALALLLRIVETHHAAIAAAEGRE